MASYRLCDTVASLDIALSVLVNADTIFIDCEGRDLGETGGRLSLISLGALHPIPGVAADHLSVFLIDVIKLSEDGILEPIYELLRRDTVLKVGYDLRMDAAEFWHGHGVQLETVLDLQVADIMARAVRREGLDEQLKRLVGFVPRHELRRNREMWVNVQKLNGLDWALKDLGLAITAKQKVDHSLWLERPLDLLHLEYAAEDIHKVQLLYDAMLSNRLMNKEKVIKQSQVYSRLHLATRPDRYNKYKHHGLVPLA
ncbi:hypothetical protein FRC16_007776, partial [Serendipita sp. 398]